MPHDTDQNFGRILISNDDGIDAAGIKILYEIACKLTDDVWIVAPMDNKSGASRSITLRKDVHIEERGPQMFACSGTPSDCIIFGMNRILDRKPDLVLSGINAGMNVADDVLYSGTIAAAMEANLMDIPAIALSQRNGGEEEADFAVAARYGETVIRNLCQMGWGPRMIMNINFPSVPVDSVKGITPATLDRHKIGDEIIDGSAPNAYQLGPLVTNPVTLPGSDRNVMDEHWISLTALSMDIIAREAQSKLPTFEF